MRATTIERWIPGLRLLRTYQRQWFRSDVLAGLSVAAVALPTAIAYAQLAGFPPVVGIYSSILPPVAYALFGSSRQLVLNPDTATCAIVAATLAPLAAGDPARYGSLSAALAILVGLMCIGGGILRLGVIANFLPRPILTGFLNGIALSIISGQLGKLFGFSVSPQGFFRTLAEFAAKLDQTHGPTLILGLSLFLVLRILKRVSPRIPAPLIVAALGIGAVYVLGLEKRGVAVVGTIPAGLPAPRLPVVAASDLGSLAFGALGIVLVSFCSMVLTARSFANRNAYAIDANQDFVALGIADLAAGLSQGFVISGADSRTAVADAAGGKSQVASLVAAAAMAAVLLFMTAPLAYLPIAALAAILISAAIGLFDVPSLQRFREVNGIEYRQSLIATLGVITVGVLPGILVAVGLALAKLLSLAAHPRDAVLGRVEGKEGWFDLTEEPAARPLLGLVIYRFDAALLFFNADTFKERVRRALAGAGDSPEWFLFNAESTLLVDITGADVLEELRTELAGQRITFAIARAKGFFYEVIERSGLVKRIGAEHVFPSIDAGARAFLQRKG